MKTALDTSYEIIKTNHLVWMKILGSRCQMILQGFESCAQQDGLFVLRLYRASLPTTKFSRSFGKSQFLLLRTQQWKAGSRVCVYAFWVLLYGMGLAEFLKHVTTWARPSKSFRCLLWRTNNSWNDCHTLQSVQSNEKFGLFWGKVTRMASNIDVDDPVLPRQWKRPRRYEEWQFRRRFPQRC